MSESHSKQGPSGHIPSQHASYSVSLSGEGISEQLLFMRMVGVRR